MRKFMGDNGKEEAQRAQDSHRPIDARIQALVVGGKEAARERPGQQKEDYEPTQIDADVEIKKIEQMDA